MTQTIKFNPSVSPRKENIYLEEYYSGVDCRVYIDGKLCENVSGIGFQVQEQLKPLYGYASRTYDDVAVGNRIVIGNLQIPIANPTATNLSISEKEKTLDLRVSEISSVLPSSAMPTNTSSQSIEPIPAWVQAWVEEFGYQPWRSNSLNAFYTGDVFDVQQKLDALGYNVELTGRQDKKTEEALLAYQQTNELNISGVIDEETYRHLMLIDAYQGKPMVTIQETLSVRVGPGLHYPVFFTLNPGDSAVCLSSYQDFTRLRLEDGREGYAVKATIDAWLGNMI